MILNIKSLLVTCTLSVASIHAFAHGEDKPGPNGGHIRMPGAYHTEVITEQDAVKVYLLDVEFQNPTTKNSSVTLSWKTGNQTIQAKCSSQESFFLCRLPKNTSLQSGSLLVESKREGITANTATYELPLKFAQNSAPKKDDDHSMHH